jgi:hypothetical protein
VRCAKETRDCFIAASGLTSKARNSRVGGRGPRIAGRMLMGQEMPNGMEFTHLLTQFHIFKTITLYYSELCEHTEMT